jgi:hypothetical protein
MNNPFEGIERRDREFKAIVTSDYLNFGFKLVLNKVNKVMYMRSNCMLTF